MRFILSFFLLFTSLQASAATQGGLGNNSSGDIEINLTLGLLARISGLADMAFGTWNGGDLTSNQNICVGLYGTNSYRFRASGSGDGSDANAFALSNGSDYLPYRVFFNDQTGLTGRTELTASNSLTNQTASGSFWNLFGCLINNANLSILLEDASLASASTGNYTGTLTVTVIPE